MAAPAFRAATTANTEEGSSITFTEPAGAALNDALIMIVSVLSDGGPAVFTTPTGWTLENLTNDGGDEEQVMFSIRRGASAPTLVLNWTNTADAVGTMIAYSGADTTTLTEVPAGQHNTSSTSVTAPSITTTVADCMLVGGFGQMDPASAPTFTPPTGMTERTDHSFEGGLGFIAHEVAEVAQAAAAASGTKVATSTLAAGNVGQLVAIRPVAGAPPAEPYPAERKPAHLSPLLRM